MLRAITVLGKTLTPGPTIVHCGAGGFAGRSSGGIQVSLGEIGRAWLIGRGRVTLPTNLQTPDRPLPNNWLE